MPGKGGNVLGGILLIGGSCVGVGMLALPILTGLSGFFPSLLMFVCAWLFMTITGLLMIEVNSWFSDQVNIVSMAGHALGKVGRTLSWVLYLFLYYALLVAYISGSGNLSATLLNSQIPIWLGSLFFVILFGWVVYMGTRTVDLWNRCLMIGKIGAYLGIIFLGAQYVAPKLLLRSEPHYMIYSLPILVIAFGYHNMIPTLMAYLNNDVKKVRQTIIGGTLLVFVIYIIWEIIVLGILPMEGEWGIKNSLKLDREAAQAISGILTASWIRPCAQALAFFAMLTAFLAQSLAFVHFLADGFKVKTEKKENLWLCLVALAPPLALSLIYPQLFFKALNFAGGFCTVILFGILPASMAWIGRYRKKIPSTYQVFGGKKTLIAVFAFSLFILFFQISSMLDHPFTKF